MAERKAPARKKAPAKKSPPAPVAARKPNNEPAQPAPQPAEWDDTAAGYIGRHTDQTPNEHYTLAGVLAGLPVPEHDKPVG